MTEQTYYMNIIMELKNDGILTKEEAKKAQSRVQKKVGYNFHSWVM